MGHLTSQDPTGLIQTTPDSGYLGTETLGFGDSGVDEPFIQINEGGFAKPTMPAECQDFSNNYDKETNIKKYDTGN